MVAWNGLPVNAPSWHLTGEAQRFDSALRLNVHSHTEALDGVYVEQDGQLVFHPLGEPSAEDIEYVAASRQNVPGSAWQLPLLSGTA